ncbi:MAG TPA: L-threonylcarbamoyladenylate synthase [Candidatus Hydrogenedentes bacterium]|nr:L-threonylcarbamoyladenylate synthase [Candidatus Hydrogenedentota bacterium]HNT86963.1 L-threonylcarbamoyladenylate synthase [Candidatus Hydrogenedentota bacterium]
MKVVPATPKGLAEAVAALRDGCVVAYPTETVYGLAVDPFSGAALDRLFDIKRRDAAKPLLLVIGELRQLAPIVQRVPAEAWPCMDTFWPGPLTLLFPKNERLPSRLTADRDKVAVRLPACATARALCSAFGGALTSSSANQSGAPPARCVDEINLAGVDLAIDGGLLPESPPSTLFDPVTGEVLRAGAIPEAALRHIRPLPIT